MRVKTSSSVRRRVLGLIQDDERVVQGSPAHEGEGATSIVPLAMRRWAPSGPTMS